MSSDFAIRPMRPEDAPFVFKAWLEGYWPHFPGNVVMTKSEFMQRWHRVIERILSDPRTRTVVAHVEGDADVLLGFACGTPEAVHWAYVKQAFRRLGIARELTSRMGCAHSHWSQLLWRNDRGLTYDPQLLKGYA